MSNFSPYDLPSYKDVNVYPIAEFYHKGKPFLYVGASSGNDGEKIWYYDINSREKITISVKRGSFSVFGATIDGDSVSFYSEWPAAYLDHLPEYIFTSKKTAGHYGHNYKIPIKLVFKYNNDFGLFRMAKGNFRSIYFPVLSELLKLNL